MPRLNSPDEETLRIAVEAWLKRRWPEARVVHELVLEQGGNRIDLASIGTTDIRLVELKSKRDTLDRLPDQIASAREVAGEVWIALDAEKLDAFEKLSGFWNCGLLIHRDGELTATRAPRYSQPDPRRVAGLLWAAEPRSAFGGERRATRTRCIERAVDELGLREITRRVAVQLKGRSFPRADAPSERTP